MTTLRSIPSRRQRFIGEGRHETGFGSAQEVIEQQGWGRDKGIEEFKKMLRERAKNKKF